jgi:predicted site-specific integrase-resolvase
MRGKMIIGYARVSTQEQSLDAQIEELKAAGAERIFAEKASGAWRERPELAKLKAQVTYGDVVMVTRLDRLARSTRDLSAPSRIRGSIDLGDGAAGAANPGLDWRVRTEADPVSR